jgi:hypothetical protein
MYCQQFHMWAEVTSCVISFECECSCLKNNPEAECVFAAAARGCGPITFPFLPSCTRRHGRNEMKLLFSAASKKVEFTVVQGAHGMFKFILSERPSASINYAHDINIIIKLGS